MLSSDVWAVIALHIAPNPIVYTRLSHVCQASRAEFTADKLWRVFTPGMQGSDHMSAFFARLGADAGESRKLWSQLVDYDFWGGQDVQGGCPSNLDLALPWVVLRGTRVFKSADSWDDFDDEDEEDEDEDDDGADGQSDNQSDNQSDGDGFAVPPEIALNAVTLWGPLLQHIANPSKELVLAAVGGSSSLGLRAPETDGHALRFAPQFNKDLDIIRAAVLNDPLSFEYAHSSIQENAATVLPLARLDGNVLAFASPEIRNNKAVLLEAVEATGNGLAYASHALKGDREVVLASVTARGTTLRDALPRWRIDDDIIAAACANDPLAAQFIPEDIDELRVKLGVKYKPTKANLLEELLKGTPKKSET